MASPFTFCLVNREYSRKKNQTEKKKKQKKQMMLYNMSEQTLGVCEWWASSIFSDRGHYHKETSALISRTIQWTGFYMAKTSVMKELMVCYLHIFIEIYSLIMRK